MKGITGTLVLLVWSCGSLWGQGNSPLLWLKPDSVTSGHLIFKDAGTQGLEVQLTGSGQLPDSVGFNYNPALYFNGASRLTRLNQVPALQKQLTFIAVYEADTSDQEFGLYRLQKDTTLIIGFSTQSIRQLSKTVRYLDSTNTHGLINVLSQHIHKMPGGSNPSELILGTDGNSTFKGKVAEVLLFNYKLSRVVRNRYESYLAIKYGITLDSLDYFNASDSCIWKRKDNAAYHFGMAGIGKDGVLGLNQKQSSGHAGNDIVGIGAGKLSQSNAKNETVLPEQQFLLWGHTNHPQTAVYKDTIGTDSVVIHLRRQYRIRPAGDSVSDLPTELFFKAGLYPGYEGVFMKRRMDDVSAENIFFPDSTDAEGNAYFKQIYWDQDGSGYDVFSFGFQGEVSQIPLNNQLSVVSANNAANQQQQSHTTLQEFGKLSDLNAKVYPNPTTGPFKLGIQTSSTEETAIICYDLSGRTVLKRSVSGSRDYLIEDIQLARGHYLLVVHNTAGRKVLNLFVYE